MFPAALTPRSFPGAPAWFPKQIYDAVPEAKEQQVEENPNGECGERECRPASVAPCARAEFEGLSLEPQPHDFSAEQVVRNSDHHKCHHGKGK